MYRTQTTRFEEIKRNYQHRYKCAGCGKSRTRSYNVSETINPFNKNSDGSTKNYGEVVSSVNDKLKRIISKLKSKELYCTKCR